MSYPSMDFAAIPDKHMGHPALPAELLWEALSHMTDEELIAEAQKRGIITSPQDVVNEDAINLNEVEEML